MLSGCLFHEMSLGLVIFLRNIGLHLLQVILTFWLCRICKLFRPPCIISLCSLVAVTPPGSALAPNAVCYFLWSLLRRYQLDISSDVCQDTCSPLDCSSAVCPGGMKQWQVGGCLSCAPAGATGSAPSAWVGVWAGPSPCHWCEKLDQPHGPLRNGGSPTPPGPAWSPDAMDRQLYWNCWYHKELLAFAGAWRFQTICMALYLFSGVAGAWPGTLTKKPQCLKL